MVVAPAQQVKRKGCYLVDYHDLLNVFVFGGWQDVNLSPNFPALKVFLAFWETKLKRPLFGVTVAHSKLIKPAELRAVDGVFRLH